MVLKIWIEREVKKKRQHSNFGSFLHIVSRRRINLNDIQLENILIAIDSASESVVEL